MRQNLLKYKKYTNVAIVVIYAHALSHFVVIWPAWLSKSHPRQLVCLSIVVSCVDSSSLRIQSVPLWGWISVTMISLSQGWTCLPMPCRQIQYIIHTWDSYLYMYMYMQCIAFFFYRTSISDVISACNNFLLQFNSSVTTLILNGCKIGSKGGIHVASMLQARAYMYMHMPVLILFSGLGTQLSYMYIFIWCLRVWTVWVWCVSLDFYLYNVLYTCTCTCMCSFRYMYFMKLCFLAVSG